MKNFAKQQDAIAKIKAALAEVATQAFIESIKAADDAASGSFEGLVISTEHVDRAGEIVMQDGIDISMYMKNPVVLNSHDYWGIENIVGAATKIYQGTIDGKAATLADGKWAPTDGGQIARKLYDAKMMPACSIGFIPTEFDKESPYVITKCELLEFSMVAVPCNAYAAQMRALGLDEAMLVSKGFTIASKADELGDACELDDGTPGILAEDPENPEGALICVPKETKAASPEDEVGEEPDGDGDSPEDAYDMAPPLVKALSDHKDALEAEHGRHTKASKKHVAKLEEQVNDAYAEKSLDVEKKAIAINEAIGKFKDKMAAEHSTHADNITECYKSLVKTLGEMPEMSGDNSDETKALRDKAKAVLEALSLLNIDSLKSALDPLEKLLQGTKGEEPAAPIAPASGKGSPEAGSKPAQISDVGEFVFGREVVRSIHEATERALKNYAERGRKHARGE